MITFSDVTVQYPGQDAPAVERFSLEAPSGKITVLLGSSGCGKTTLLQCVNQLVAPSSGTVTIDGRDVREENPPNSVARSDMFCSIPVYCRIGRWRTISRLCCGSTE